jgi:hypothetical protein
VGSWPNLVNVYRNVGVLEAASKARYSIVRMTESTGPLASEVAQKADKLVLLFIRSKPARELLIAKFLEPDASQIIEFLHWN